MRRRRRQSYFTRESGAPTPIVVDVQARVRFSDADPMGIVWFGRYPSYFEEGSAALGRRCGMSYHDFREAGLRAPVIECHVDYLASLYLDEEFTIRATLVWSDGSRINTEYRLLKADGNVAASGYTIQLLTDVEGRVCLVSPPLLERCRVRWRNGDFH